MYYVRYLSIEFCLFRLIAQKGDTVEPKSAADEKLTCAFGDVTLKRGDKLNTGDKCLTCECSIPPYLTCTKTSEC